MLASTPASITSGGSSTETLFVGAGNDAEVCGVLKFCDAL